MRSTRAGARDLPLGAAAHLLPLGVGLLLAACSGSVLDHRDGPPGGADAATLDATGGGADAAADRDAAPGPDVAPGPDGAAGRDAAAGPDAPPACALTESGPVEATADGQVIERLRITADGVPGIRVHGRADVTIRDCEIHHRGAPGISFGDVTDLRIERCRIVHEGAPAAGASPSADRNNIHGYGGTGVVIDSVTLVRGSSGVYVGEIPGVQVRRVEGHDFRGPMPRGQVVQFDKCPDALLEDFSSENDPATSFTEDNVSVFQSPRVTVRRGLVDGNNSPSGVGVMFELSDGSSGGLCEDVDAIRQGNGCFSAYPGANVTFRRTRARDNVCADQGRGAPLSGGLAWAGSPDSSGLRLEDSAHFALCAGHVWDQSVFDVIELVEEDFTPRAPLRLRFCWDAP